MRNLLLCMGLFGASGTSVVAAHAGPEAPRLVFATATCAAAGKPGRIRCRGVVELPMETAAARRIVWGELRVVRTDPELAPLRGRLGLLDAETRDDGRVSWSFSVTAAQPGDRKMTVRLSATIEAKPGGPLPSGSPTLVEQDVEVPIHVSSP